MALDMKMMLEIKQVGIFCSFLTVEIFVKMSPLSGKEKAKNCRKKMSKDKLREVHGKKGNRKS